ncbi:MAG TPA: ERCC4-type nuclease [Thermoplasmata archaeon]|nr:ERCC4-type nuclease [Thermoplasmata archaeon]
MRVLIDWREKDRVASIIKSFHPIEMRQLKLGDVVLISNEEACLIERKTPSDFLQSIKTNRLWDQLLRMMKSEQMFGFPTKRKLLVVDGTFSGYEWNDAKLWRSLMGAFQEIIWVYQIPMIFAENDSALEAFFKILIDREEKQKNESVPKARWYRKPLSKELLPVRDRKQYIVSSIPFIGEKLASNLLERFETIRAIANASQNELEEVDGIGKKRADLIYQILH